METSRKAAAALGLLVTAILAGQLALFAHVQAGNPEALVAPDTKSYVNPAHALMRWGRFSTSVETPDDPEVTRTPGYPLFIAAVESVLGPNPASVVRAQILVGACGLVALYAGATRLGLGRKTALAAVALAGIEPGTVLASQMLLPETLFTGLLTAMLYCGTRLAERGRRERLWAFATGATLAAATQVRPIAYYLIAPILAWLWISARSSGRGRRAALLTCAAMFVPWLLLVVGWQARNAAVFGDATFSQIQNVNLYRYRGAGVVALRDGISLDDAQAALQKQADELPLSRAARFAYYKTTGTSLLAAHPGLALRSAAAGLARTIAGPGCLDLYMHVAGPLPTPGPLADAMHLSPSAFWRRWAAGYPFLMALLAAEAVYLAGLYLGSGVALIRAWPSIRASLGKHALWWGCLGYLLLVSAGPEAYARFRVPMTPILAGFGAWGMALFLRPRLPAPPRAPNLP